MIHIFVSHSTAKETDKTEEMLGQWALRQVDSYLHDKVPSEQYFIDRRSMASDDFYDGPIVENLGRATLGIVLATRRAFSCSRWVHFEAGVLYWRKITGEKLKLHFILIPSILRDECKREFSAIKFEYAKPFDIEVSRDALGGSWSDIKDRLERQQVGVKMAKQLDQWIDAARLDEPEPRIQRLKEIIGNLRCRLLRGFIEQINQECTVPDHALAMVAANILSAATLNDRLAKALARWCADSSNASGFGPIFQRVKMTVAPPVLAAALSSAIASTAGSSARGRIVHIRTTKRRLLDCYLDRALGCVFDPLVPHQRYSLSQPFQPSRIREQFKRQILNVVRENEKPLPGEMAIVIFDNPWLADEELEEAASEVFSTLNISMRYVALIVVHDGEHAAPIGVNCVDFANFKPSENWNEGDWETLAASCVARLTKALNGSTQAQAF